MHSSILFKKKQSCSRSNRVLGSFWQKHIPSYLNADYSAINNLLKKKAKLTNKGVNCTVIL